MTPISSIVLGITSTLIATFLPIEAAFAQSAKPNIVFILMDNLGYGEVGVYGGGITRGAPTPRIDQLATEGLRLTNFNVEAQCTPSRSAIMTGRFSIRSGTHSVPIGGGLEGLTQWEVTIAEILSGAEYATGAFGKWHLGSEQGRLPNDQGFDEWYGIPRTTDEAFWPSEPQATAAGATYEHVMEGRKGERSHDVAVYDLEQRRLIDAEIARRTIDFMKRSVASGKPFYAYVPFTLVHFPTLPNPKFSGKTGFGDFPDSLAEMDGHVGEILDAVDTLGIRDNTIVVFTSDNGPEASWPWQGSSGPWRSYYFTHMEGCACHSLSAGRVGYPQAASATELCTRSIPSLPSRRLGAAPSRKTVRSTEWIKPIFCWANPRSLAVRAFRCSWQIVWRRLSGEIGKSSSMTRSGTGGHRHSNLASRKRLT
jgi:hypothetical protein